MYDLFNENGHVSSMFALPKGQVVVNDVWKDYRNLTDRELRSIGLFRRVAPQVDPIDVHMFKYVEKGVVNDGVNSMGRLRSCGTDG